MLLVNLIGHKRCNGCQNTLYTSMFWPRSNKHGIGLQPRCKDCQRAESGARYIRDKAKIQSQNRQWIVANLARHRALATAWTEDHREERRDASRAAYHRDVEHSRAKGRQRGHKRRASMRSHISQVVTLEMWEARKSMFGNRCVYCGVPESADTPMTMDHVKPISKGGAHILSNLRPACRACNGRKHNKWSEEWVRKGLAALV